MGNIGVDLRIIMSAAGSGSAVERPAVVRVDVFPDAALEDRFGRGVELEIFLLSGFVETLEIVRIEIVERLEIKCSITVEDVVQRTIFPVLNKDAENLIGAGNGIFSRIAAFRGEGRSAAGDCLFGRGQNDSNAVLAGAGPDLCDFQLGCVKSAHIVGLFSRYGNFILDFVGRIFRDLKRHEVFRNIFQFKQSQIHIFSGQGGEKLETFAPGIFHGRILHPGKCVRRGDEHGLSPQIHHESTTADS